MKGNQALKTVSELNRSRNHTRLAFILAMVLVSRCAESAISAAAVQETDTGWPRVMTTTNGNRVEIFQPQLESWKDNHLQARAVAEDTLAGDSNPHLGVAWFGADTKLDQAQRLVALENVTIPRVRFSAVAQEEADMQTVMSNALPLLARTIALDRLTVASVMAQNRSKHSTVLLKHDGPIVIWSTNAVAALVLIDGDPVLRPVKGSSLLRVINTAALILFDPSGGTYYLAGDSGWFQAGGIAGPWAVAPNPPAAVSQLTPPTDAAANNSAGPSAQSPVVFVSTRPAELLHTVGAPNFQTEEGSGLMYVANSDSQVLYNPEGGNAYLLLSGRWFTSKGLGGPWAYVAAKDLPASFAQIIPQGPKGVVLSSVPGTPQAAAAHVANSLPQMATIQRSGASFDVQYDGSPQFKSIAGTSMQYAVNAAEAVVLCQNRYYAVGNGVWFGSVSSTGPWAVATSVPDEIYSIPASSPLYYVTYVYIGYADTNEVESAYLPGYVGSYDDEDGVGPVYGTGWSYTPWVGDYYYGWGWPYGYGYQYRWWESSWLWRPAWSRVGNLYAVNSGSVYDRWPRADSGSAYVARANADRAVGVGYPTVYGRYAGATRAVPMTVPSQTMLVDPYVKMPVATAKGNEAMLQSLKVGSAESRDLYAAGNGDIYRRQEGKWYRADTKGGWAYVTPAIGPMTHPYHPATAAYYDHPNAYRPAEMAGDYHRPYEAAAMDQDYYARASAERSWQQSQAVYRDDRRR